MVLTVDVTLVEAQKNLAVKGTRAGIVAFVALEACANYVVIQGNHAARRTPAMIAAFAAQMDNVKSAGEVKNHVVRGTYAREATVSAG